MVNDCVGDEPSALIPDLLFMLRSNTEAPAVWEGDCSAQTVVSLPSIQCTVHIAPQRRRFNIVQKIQTADGGSNSVVRPFIGTSRSRVMRLCIINTLEFLNSVVCWSFRSNGGARIYKSLG